MCINPGSYQAGYIVYSVTIQFTIHFLCSALYVCRFGITWSNAYNLLSTCIVNTTTCLFTSVPDVAPPNVECEAISDSEVMATWGDIPLSQRNGQVQYVLSLTSVDEEENIHRTTLRAPTTPIVIGGLRSNTTYFCVLGVVTNGVGPHSPPLELVTFLPGGWLCKVIICQIPMPKKCNSLP